MSDILFTVQKKYLVLASIRNVSHDLLRGSVLSFMRWISAQPTKATRKWKNCQPKSVSRTRDFAKYPANVGWNSSLDQYICFKISTYSVNILKPWIEFITKDPPLHVRKTLDWDQGTIINLCAGNWTWIYLKLYY